MNIVVANAGMEKVNIPFTDVTEEDFDLLWRVNTKGPYFVLREAARRIADNGRIVTISSNTTTVPQVGVALYGTSKIAMSYLIRVAALELGPGESRSTRWCPARSTTPGSSPTRLTTNTRRA